MTIQPCLCCDVKLKVEFEFICGVLRRMHRYFRQSYMWRQRCAGGLKKKLYLRSGSQRHRHFVGFFNVPVLHRHGTTLFIRWFRHTSVAFYDTFGIRRTYSRLKPPASSRGSNWKTSWTSQYFDQVLHVHEWKRLRRCIYESFCETSRIKKTFFFKSPNQNFSTWLANLGSSVSEFRQLIMNKTA